MSKTWAALGAAICAASLALPAQAAPRAESALECGIAADMAVVAHSLAAENIQQAQAGAIMARIYDVSGSPRGRELMSDILSAAYRVNATAGVPGASSGGTTASNDSQKFAEKLLATCMETGGSMDQVLGQKS